uniref:Uncharacterized protein n=1 Tax=Romanomermis culicivorax TaxID=13658 RepID=A0A915JEJ9_ROMCU
MACCRIKAGKHTKNFSQLFGIPLFEFMEIKEEFVRLFWIFKWPSIWQSKMFFKMLPPKDAYSISAKV